MSFVERVDHIFLLNPDLDELLLDGFDSVCKIVGDQKSYENGSLILQSIEELQDFALAQGVRWDPMQPAAGGCFSRGSLEAERHYRWHGLLPPIARDGLLLSIRRHRLGQFSLRDYLDESPHAKLLDLLSSDRPVLVFGPTGSGKTSFMVSALLEFAKEERIAILEQLPELPKLSPRWIRLCAQSANVEGQGLIPLEYLVDELLRLRPDRMIIGELRREEIFAFKRALLAGHSSVWTTLHAGSAEQIPGRLAELGGACAREWQEILVTQSALAIKLNRQAPRFQGIWRFTEAGVISCF